MRTVCSFSGGKDSTALLFELLRRKMPVDDIVWMDCGNWEFEQMRKHIIAVERIIKRPITKLTIPKGLDYWMFNYRRKKVTKRNIDYNKKRIYGLGWPTPVNRWCNGIKVAGLNKKTNQAVVYIGINADEQRRCGKSQVPGRVIVYPLVEWGIGAEEALEICRKKELDWGGLYKHFENTSCFCCPLKSRKALRNLWKFYPELWARLKAMDRRSWNTFQMNYVSVEKLEQIFIEEEKISKVRVVMEEM